MSPFEWLQAGAVTIAGLVAVSIIAAYIYGRTRRAADEDRDRLLELRRARVDELEAKVASLEEKVARVQGMFEALQALKAQEIAKELIVHLENHGLLVQPTG